MNKTKVFKGLRIFCILLLILAVLVGVTSVRNVILSARDEKLVEDAYGEYYTTPEGERINYTFYDNGVENLAVILPGYGCSSAHFEFDTLAKRLSDRYDILIVEPLGVGLSDGTTRERSAENYCVELHGLMASLGYDRYTLIGHSIAGIYALKYCNMYENEVEAFIGIDASVPRQIDIDNTFTQSDVQYKINRALKFTLVDTGIYRILTEVSFDSVLEQIPTIRDDDKDTMLALYTTDQMNDTQLREGKKMTDNMRDCYDMTFPKSVKVLYILSKDNCDQIPEWEQLHSDIVEKCNGEVKIVDGGHYLHLTNLDGLLKAIEG